MLENLINSKTRLAILSLFFKNKDKKYYGQEVGKTLGLNQANVHKEIVNLLKGEFLTVEKIEGKKYFSVNQNNRFFNELESMFKKYGARKAGKEIFCLEEIPNYYPLFAIPAWNEKAINYFSDLYKFKNRLRNLVIIFENNICRPLVSKESFNSLSKEIFIRVRDDAFWRKKYINDLRLKVVELYKESDKLKKTNLKSLSDKEIASIFEKFYKVYSDLHLLHVPQTVLDFGEGFFSKYLMTYLKGRVKAIGLSLGDVFSTLTTPIELSKSVEEYHDLLLILKHICSDTELKEYFKSTESRIIVLEIFEVNKKIANRLKEHANNFGFLGYGTVGPSWTQEYFIDILSSLIRQNINPDSALAEIENNKIKTERRQRELEKKLKIDIDHLNIFQFARDLIFTKSLRKDAIFNAIAILENLYREVSRRYYLSLRQVRHLQPDELPKLLRGQKISAELLNERFNFSVHYSTDNLDSSLFLVGAKAKKFVDGLNIIKEEIRDVKILAGDCASPGRVRGEAKIINVIADMEKMKVGNILISVATTPDLVPAIKKASAIVTDVGGITCHAAIISRELGIPCVVGTKIATKIIKDGMIVDVDATHGKVDMLDKD